ncbi:subfamily B ATP-binding cassette protein MsbA [Paenibacillus endophyticus]|uniref:Subfamily B ATP-binding cassette protein MsbA n=1 Tax=Paenibacillus endophyticus TaxID=1294268 RepID=A0A7W5CDY0_9BACL|nr:ABC transporter ATP-binding protein [Paenibacillus endophyticus]MBB3155460.1 subfamily B ATP-binding cassette protein MsbA [Paenibacillus endophyticus]
MKYLKIFWSNSVMLKGTYLMVLLYLALESVSNYTLVYVQKILIDDVFTKGRYELLPIVIGVFAAAGLIYSLMFTMTSRSLVRNEFAVSRSLLSRMLKRLEGVPIERFQQERTGKYVYSFTQDLFISASVMGWQIPRGMQEILNLCILMVIIGLASPTLLLLIVGLCAIYVLIGYYFTPKLKAQAKQVAEKRTALLIQIEEGVASTREVVAYHRLKWESKLYNKMFAEYFDQVMAEGKLVNRQIRYSDPMKWGIGIVVLGYCGMQLINEQMSIGTFVILFQFSTQMADAFYNIFQFVMGMSSQLANVDRVQRILELEQADPGKSRMQGKIDQLSFEQVGFRYSPELPEVIRGFTAELPIGQKIAFVGTSGGGKSTVAQLLVRFFDVSLGHFKLNEKDASAYNRDEWAQRVSIVFQDPYMFSDTIRENVMLGRDGVSEADMEEACRIAQIHDFILGLPEGYATNVGERGIKLSGGQRQRIAIARAIVNNPEILVLDEATSALDLETERLLLGALEARREGLTTIMIAHRLSTIENADVIFVMDQGALAESGTHQELLAEGRVYQQLLMAQH